MLNTPTEAQMATIPGLYETDHISTQDQIIHAHFHIGQSHWFISEYDRVDVMFGFCILNGDMGMSEWGYASFGELKDTNILGLYQVQFNVYWTPKPAGQIEFIRRGDGIYPDTDSAPDRGPWTWYSLNS